MEINEFIKNFAEQFDDTDPSEIMENTNYLELEEWSSLTAMSIMAMIKSVYKKDITGKEIRSCDTVKDLFNLLAEK